MPPRSLEEMMDADVPKAFSTPLLTISYREYAPRTGKFDAVAKLTNFGAMKSRNDQPGSVVVSAL
jgi:hypothetical protein